MRQGTPDPEPVTLFWLLLGALGALGLALLNHFSELLPPTSTFGLMWIASGLLLLAIHFGRGGGGAS